MNLDGFEKLYLTGDEDGGVSLGCREHLDTNPLAYWGTPARKDDEITIVSSFQGLLAVGRAHLNVVHKMYKGE